MYLMGFGNHHSSEAITGALPHTQNSPQKCNLGLYAEQLSGSAFTCLNHDNLHSWLYRTLPSVLDAQYIQYDKQIYQKFAKTQAPNPWRWSPQPELKFEHDFIDGLWHLAGNRYLNAYIYQCNCSMVKRYFSNSDGELLFIPYKGMIRLRTEFGLLEISPGMIAVIPRGIYFKVELCDKFAEGYLCENQAQPLSLPQRGVIGANGLANARHFFYPRALIETEYSDDISLICKSQQNLWIAPTKHSPLNVVAWHGNYAPYGYDTSLFNALNTVDFDHPDPSIFTVLSSASNTKNVSNLDFVIFPPRWMVAEHTFRAPYYHRNIMNEFMGLVCGVYDAKQVGFEIGGVSIHNCMTPHGPDTSTYLKASNAKLKPMYYSNTLAFMLESRISWKITEIALSHSSLQKDYIKCFSGLKNYFQSKSS